MADELEKMEQEINAKAEEIKAEQAKTVEEPAAPPIEEPTPVAAAPAVETPVTPGIETTEYGKKKGFKSAEEAAESMRQLERAFHEKAAELKRLQEAQQPPMPPQGYMPPQNPYAPPAPQYYPPQGYAPPQNPYAPAPRMTEEQLAASYGATPEAFRAILGIAQDVAENKTRQTMSEFQRWKQDVEMKNAKSDDMTQILADPAFHNPEVRAEIHEIFSKKPELFNEPRPYSTAMTQALANIGRKTTTRGATNGAPSFPSEPPKQAGSGNGYSGRKQPGAMPSEAEQRNMTPEQLEKALASMGAVKTYADL